MSDVADFLLFPRRELFKFAGLVKELRTVQKATGKGYKTAADTSKAAALEKSVDAELHKILGS
jgi:hypothetical protein